MTIVLEPQIHLLTPSHVKEEDEFVDEEFQEDEFVDEAFQHEDVEKPSQCIFVTIDE
jgi:hypothetical protein